MEAIKFNNYYRNMFSRNYPYYGYTYNRTSEMTVELKEALASIKDSVEGEIEDAAFYTMLLSLTSNKEDIEIINSIISDEKKHNLLLRNLYFELTNKKLPENREEKNVDNMLNYRRNLKKALMGELDAVKRYRKIMAAMPDENKYAVVMEILTDEIRHANLYNYLIAKSMQML